MKTFTQAKLFLLATTLLASSAVFAGPGQIGSSENSLDAIERSRTQAVKAYVVQQSQIKGSNVQKALENIQVSTLDTIQVVQTDQIINGHPADSTESRAFLVVVPYLDGQFTNFDENDEYRSNTARFSSVLLKCDLDAQSYGSKSIKIACSGR